jgi:hypothetical protein
MTSSAAAPRGHTPLEKKLLFALRTIADHSAYDADTFRCDLEATIDETREAALAAIKLATGAP